jgi:hypothetical protein
MQISDEDLEEFRRIYKEEFGEEISLAEAQTMGNRLIELFRIIMRPLPGEEGFQETPPRTAS